MNNKKITIRKNLTLLLLAFFLSTDVFSQTSSLTVFSESGNPFYLVLNGIRQNEGPETNVRVNGLNQDYYATRIIFEDEGIPSIDKKGMMVVDYDSKKGEVVYKITRTKKGLKLRYFSFVPAAEVVAPPASVKVIEYHTTPLPPIASVTHTETISTTHHNADDNIGVNMNLGGINIGVNINDNGLNSHHSTSSTSTTTTTTVISNQNHSGHDHSSHGHHQEVVEEPTCQMDAPNFSEALSSIKSKSFSDSKLKQANQISKSYCLTAVQIKEIVKVFDFESTRLDFAKSAYSNCYDKENYWKINDAFDFESSIDELDSYTK